MYQAVRMECFRQVSCPVAVCDVISSLFKMINCMCIECVFCGRCIGLAGCRAFALLIDSTDHYSIAVCTVSCYMFLVRCFICTVCMYFCGCLSGVINK